MLNYVKLCHKKRIYSSKFPLYNAEETNFKKQQIYLAIQHAIVKFELSTEYFDIVDS